MTKPVSVLFVDDEDILRMLMKDQLTAEGYSVETADDGDTALEILARKNFDLLLVDIRMPRMNGIELLKQIRRQKIQSRVLVLTAVDDISIAIEAVKQGANDYLTKPIELNSLTAAIDRILAT
ncbi:MAG TPA: response regulator [Bacteroidota bacterium]|nr:response regulator [Bacteroidota bacterium]